MRAQCDCVTSDCLFVTIKYITTTTLGWRQLHPRDSQFGSMRSVQKSARSASPRRLTLVRPLGWTLWPTLAESFSNKIKFSASFSRLKAWSPSAKVERCRSKFRSHGSVDKKKFRRSKVPGDRKFRFPNVSVTATICLTSNLKIGETFRSASDDENRWPAAAAVGSPLMTTTRRSFHVRAGRRAVNHGWRLTVPPTACHRQPQSCNRRRSRGNEFAKKNIYYFCGCASPIMKNVRRR